MDVEGHTVPDNTTYSLMQRIIHANGGNKYDSHRTAEERAAA